MARSRTNMRSKASAFASKADSVELRDYQRKASEFPPLSHDEIVELSKKFIEGRNASVFLEEYKVVDSIVNGDWSDETLLVHQKDIIKAYAEQIKWIGDSEKYEYDSLETLLPDLDDPRAVYDARNDNLLAHMPWMREFSLAKAYPKCEHMPFDEFLTKQGEILSRADRELDKVRQPNTPKDVIARWKSRKSALSKRFLVTVKEIPFDDKERRRAKVRAVDSKIALEEIVNHNMQLAMSRIGKIMKVNKRAQAIGVADLIGAANVGLVMGARQFDPYMGRKFSTYAAFHIDGQLYDFINKENGKSGIRGPSVHEQKQLNTLLTMKNTFRKLYGRDSTMKELQSISNISLAVIKKRLSTPALKTQSINAAVGQQDADGSDIMLEDVIESTETIESEVSKSQYNDMLEDLKREIEMLPPIQRQVLVAKMGLATDENNVPIPPKTSRKAAEECGISVGELNAVYDAAIKTLRGKLELRGWSGDNLFVDGE